MFIGKQRLPCLDGSFALTGIGPEDWTLTATAPALSSQDSPIIVRAGAKDVRIVVTR